MTERWTDSPRAGYVEVVDRFKRGETEQARALLFQLSADLVAATEAYWAEGRRQAAAGDHFGALESFGQVVERLRDNPLQIALPVQPAACYGAIAGVLRALDQPLAVGVAMTLATRGTDGFYRPAPSCQIPILGGLLEALFGARDDGVFVEVGAFDGDTFSNTSCLADLGWRGLYVEPVDRLFEACRARHAGNPGISVLNAAIGATAGTLQIWDQGAYSRNAPEPLLAGATTMPARALEVRQVRLDTALTEAGIAPGFDLLVVDVEGMEEAVFASFELGHWRPRNLIVELMDPRPAAPADTDEVAAGRRLRETLRRAGYATVYRDHCNTVFQDGAA